MMDENDSPNDKQYEHKDDLECSPLYFHDLTPKLKQQAREELHEDDDNLRTSLDELLRMIKDKEGNDSPLSDDELIPFLRARKFDVKRAYNMYQKYCNKFCCKDSIFQNFQFAYNLKPLQSNFLCFRPKRDIDGCVVVCIFMKNWNVRESDPISALRNLVIMLIDIIRCPITQIAGAKYITDFSGMSVNQMRSIRPWHLKYCADIFENSIPMRVKEMHAVNNGPLVYFLWVVIKAFLSSKIIERVYFHGHDLKSLHKHISPSVLPEELGGNMGPQDNSEWLETFFQSENFLITYIKKLRREKNNA